MRKGKESKRFDSGFYNKDRDNFVILVTGIAYG